jgi:hypothetical protein
MDKYPTPEEIRERVESGRAAIIACCRAEQRDGAGRSQGVRKGYSRGFHCLRCDVEIQASPRGVAMIGAGAFAFCNECAILVAEFLKADGRLENLLLSPEARAAVRGGRSCIDPARIGRLLRKEKPS